MTAFGPVIVFMYRQLANLIERHEKLGGHSQMDARVSKIEGQIEDMIRHLSEVKTDSRDHNAELRKWLVDFLEARVETIDERLAHIVQTCQRIDDRHEDK